MLPIADGLSKSWILGCGVKAPWYIVIGLLCVVPIVLLIIEGELISVIVAVVVAGGEKCICKWVWS